MSCRSTCPLTAIQSLFMTDRIWSRKLVYERVESSVWATSNAVVFDPKPKIVWDMYVSKLLDIYTQVVFSSFLPLSPASHGTLRRTIPAFEIIFPYLLRRRRLLQSCCTKSQVWFSAVVSSAPVQLYNADIVSIRKTWKTKQTIILLH